MATKNKKRLRQNREVIYRNNKPVSVIIDIEEYNELLERLEDIEDLKFIKELRNRHLSFKKLNDFLTDFNPNV